MSIARTAATGGDLDPEFLQWQTSLPYDHRLLAVDVAGSVVALPTTLEHSSLFLPRVHTWAWGSMIWSRYLISCEGYATDPVTSPVEKLGSLGGEVAGEVGKQRFY